ncbi:MAG TPA: carboxypeptidase-like regulatory domain-containing protein [Candidatus Thermoplasmatota archaeon]|nr:carboxypeptidase-like regulatory domain-containing protein [Candidatus Thermoplasmatota archaeon]
MRLVALAGMLFVAMLAGCASQAADTPTADGALDLSSVSVSADATSGSIRGVVVDEAIRPIAKAMIQMGERNATADEQGRFSFANIKPGTVFVKAAATGYLASQTSVIVEAGKVSDVRIALPADLNPVPFHQTMQYKGFIQFSGGIATYAVDLLANTTGVTVCPSCTLYFQNDASVTTIVYEAVWTENTPPPTGPSEFYWEVELAGEDSGHIESAYSASPVLAHMGAQEHWANQTHLQARLTGPFEWVEYNQEYQMFVTLFHVTPASKGWSFVKGDA